MLYDVVLAALEHDEALVIQTDDVARTVDEFRIGFIQGILHECCSRLFGVVVVTHCQGSTSDAEFAFDPWLTDGLVFIVEDDDVRVVAGVADGQGFLVGNLLINNKIGAVEGNLDRTVKIGEGSLGQMMVPVVVLLCGEHLAGEPYRAQALESEG